MELKQIADQIEEQLERLKIDVIPMNLDDGDLNYYLDINAGRFFEELKKIGRILTLMYIDKSDFSLTIYCSNLYRECRKESIIKVMNIANLVNQRITYGKIFIDSKGKVVYQHTVLLNEGIIDIEKYIKALLVAITIFYQEMKKFGDNEKT